jgi:hypothetical protein
MVTTRRSSRLQSVAQNIIQDELTSPVAQRSRKNMHKSALTGMEASDLPPRKSTRTNIKCSKRSHLKQEKTVKKTDTLSIRKNSSSQHPHPHLLVKSNNDEEGDTSSAAISTAERMDSNSMIMERPNQVDMNVADDADHDGAAVADVDTQEENVNLIEEPKEEDGNDERRTTMKLIATESAEDNNEDEDNMEALVCTCSDSISSVQHPHPDSHLQILTIIMFFCLSSSIHI